MCTPYSYLVRLVTPHPPGAQRNPETVFRLDPSGVGDIPADPNRCITTNHYAGADHETLGDSIQRYRTLEAALNNPVTDEVAWSALRAVAAEGATHGTLHSLIYYPQRRRIDLAFASWNGQFTPAPTSPPASIAFDELFHIHR